MDWIEWRQSGNRIDLGGTHVFVRSRGRGPTALLFLHGFPTSSYDFDEVIAHLEGEHQCVAFDFGGFGDSDPLERYNFERQTDLTLAVAHHAGIHRAVVVAHDYGVTVAQELLARRDDALRIEGVVFLNGSLHPSLHRALPIQRLLASPLGAWAAPLLIRKRTLARSMRRIFVDAARFDVDQHWQAMTARGAAARTHHLLHYIAERREHAARWNASFADRATPIALLWGERDPVSGSHVLAWARAQRPDADVLCLDVGHYPQLEDPAPVAAFIAAFAAKHGAATSKPPTSTPPTSSCRESDT